jgi:hypothetical protein
MPTLPITPLEIAAWIVTVFSGVVLGVAIITVAVLCIYGAVIVLGFFVDILAWIVKQFDREVK